ncbi:hypothetical protein BH09MYX1_BH09MYX1_22130 [soil metagenome]
MISRMATTPYRAHGGLGTTLPDPTRARTALGLVAIGGVLSFIALSLAYVFEWSHPMAILLAVGGAATILGLALAGASNRSMVTLVSALVLGAAYVNPTVWGGLLGRSFPIYLTWPIRYACVASGSIALLVVFRRLQRHSFGFPLRLAAIVGGHWALVRVVSLYVPHAEESGEVALLARTSWLLLGLGAWQLRRYIGVSLPTEPEEDDLGAAASTRLAVAALSLFVRIALVVGYSSTQAMRTCSAAADVIAGIVLVAVEVPTLSRLEPKRAKLYAAFAVVALLPIVLVRQSSLVLVVLPFLQIAPAFVLSRTVRAKEPVHRKSANLALGLQIAAAIASIAVFAHLSPLMMPMLATPTE